jgi:hypothetical protein
MIHSVLPVHGIAVAFTESFRQMLHVFTFDGVAIAPGRRVPIVMDCVTEPGMMFGMSQIFPKDQTRRRTGSQD